MTIRAGSIGIKCPDSRKAFFDTPEIQKFYDSNINERSTSSAGDDSRYYLQKDVHCHPLGGRSEVVVAASLMAGKLMAGETLWRTENGVSYRKLKAVESIAPLEMGDVPDELIKRYDDAAAKMFEINLKNRSRLIDILSLAFHLKCAIGTKNEDRFVVPRQVDNCLATFGVLCEEEDAYDIRIPEFDYTISDKMMNDLFHHSTSRKVRTGNIKGDLMMSNIRSGQSSEKHMRPQFDALLVMQYIPFLVCGVVPYHKIIPHFKKHDGGWVIQKVPTSYFRYVISPTETISPRAIPPEMQQEIEDFAFLVKGGFLPKLLDKLPKIDETPLAQSEIW